mgnify:CR=1 FL=1
MATRETIFAEINANKAETGAPGVGAIRLRLVATRGGAPFALKGEDGRYLPDVLLDLDYWALMPQ